MYNPVSIFESLSKKITETKNQVNTNLLPMKPGDRHVLRLLWLPSEKREAPMIERYVHSHWDNGAVGNKAISLICPTTDYDNTANPFDACPVCKIMSKMYKEMTENKSESLSKLYNEFKRKFEGYIPVYVINSSNESIVGTVKILKYGKTIKKFFDYKIFGKISQADEAQLTGFEDESESRVGIDSFAYYDADHDNLVTSGYNLQVSITSGRANINGRMVDIPEYHLDFSRKMTELTDTDGNAFSKENFIKINDEIGFDKNYYKLSNLDDLAEFAAKYISGSTVKPVTSAEAAKTVNKTAEPVEDSEDLIEGEELPDIDELLADI